MSDTSEEVCGSWRVIERVEGLEARLQWCSRRKGPCQFPGTEQGTGTDRRCGALPGKVLRITYGDDVLQLALADLERYAKGENPTHLANESRWVAIDALRACLGESS